MEKVISHFEKHGKVLRDQLITVGDLLEFKDLLISELKSVLKDQVTGKTKKWLKACAGIRWSGSSESPSKLCFGNTKTTCLQVRAAQFATSLCSADNKNKS